MVERVQISAAGGYDRLSLVTLPHPTRGPNITICDITEEMLVTVRVDAAGVNYADVCVRWGLYASAKKYVGWPITPGFEVSGVVTAVGSSVTDLHEGKRCLFNLNLHV